MSPAACHESHPGRENVQDRTLIHQPPTESSLRVALTAGNRHGAKRYAAPDLHRPDRPNPFGAIAAWNGEIVEVYVVLQGFIGRLIIHESHYLAVLEVSRLARDESAQDPAYLKEIILQHCNGRIITRRKTLSLYEGADRRHYDLESRMAAWRRQDDVEKSMDGYRRYIEDVVRGRREITMPHRLSFGYRRQPVVDTCGNVQILANNRVRTELALDENLIETMHAFRRAADVHSDASTVARELNDAHLPGPNR